jgi:N-acetyl-1-D-myo-inositol-2-amino-2-deoxy-alpha-D-glucopyranoside deacetylase
MTDVDGDATRPGLVAVHAHPDDEAISTGGLLARAAEAGWRTAVITCTGGEQGEIVDDAMDAAEVAPRLAEVLRAALAEALAALGAGEPILLGYRDSGMRGDPANHDPGSFWRAPFDEAVGRLVTWLRRLRPTLVVTYDAFGLYGHPDHLQAHRTTLCAVEAAAVPALYPHAGPAWRTAALDLATVPRGAVATANRLLAEHGISSPFGTETEPSQLTVGIPDEEVDLAVDVRAWLSAKQAALRAHRSQIAVDSLFLNVPEDLAEAMFGTEWFVRVRGLVVAADDPLAGLAPGGHGG